MEQKKVKLLIQPSDGQGVGHFRSVWPAQCMQKNFSNEFDVDINLEVRFNDFDYLSQFDIIHFHRQFGPYEEFQRISAELRKRGVIVVMDIDDYWEPPTTHPLYEIVKSEKMTEKIKNNLKFSDYITTTTSCFKTHIQKYNDNVFIIPNALDMEHKMWSSEIEENQTDKCRIAWIGGSSHLHDLQIITQSMLKLNNSFELKNKYQIIVCGFDVRGTITEILPNGQRNVRKILPHETVWCKFENIFTSNGLLLNDDPEYIKWLGKMKREEYPDEYKKNFVRRWTLPLTQYGKHYNYCDVCIAPLETVEVYKELADTKESTISTDARKGTVKSRPHYFNEVKCIVGNSLISTNKGLLKIKDIFDSKEKYLTEINGKKSNVVNYFEYKNIDTVKITTENGYEIEGTPHHKLLIDGDWNQLDNLEVGDEIELTPPVFIQNEYQCMSFPMLLTKNVNEEKIRNCEESMIPKIKVNERWGRFLGYMYGKSMIRILCDKRHTDVIEDVVSIFKSIGLNPLLCEKKPDKRCKNSLAKEGFGVDIVSTCITFLKIAKKYNLCGSNGKIFRIPNIILQSPKSVIKEFLRGLFEADGTIENTGLSLCSKDLELIKQVQIVLLGFGIISKISYSYNKAYRKYYYRLNLNRSASDIFVKEINFVSENKKERLKIVTEKSHSNAFKPQSFRSKVQKIEFCKNDVYDIEINEAHSYNANGIINHNSELKIIEAGMKKKVLIAQDFGTYRELLKNGETGILVSDNDKGWFKAMRDVINNKEYREKLANNLHEFVKDKYDIMSVTGERTEIYKQMIEEKNSGELERKRIKQVEKNLQEQIKKEEKVNFNSPFNKNKPLSLSEQLLKK